MKILLISFSHYPTLQNYLYLLKSNLMKENAVVFSLGNANVTTTYDTLENSYFVNCIDSASPSGKNIKLYFSQKKKIMEIISMIQPDAVLFTSKHIWNFFMMPFLRRKGVKIFHVFHDPIGHAGTNVSKGVVAYNKVISKYLSGIIIHSEISLQNTLQYIKPKCKVIKVPLGEKKWLPYQASDSFKKKLLIFGRISTYKGCEFIVPLAHELAKRAVDCRIVVAGKALDDVQQQMMDGIAKCDNVELINEFIPENELHGYFYSADASLILHKSISQSGVIIDAYRHGHPIICFDIEGISEFIGDNTALVAPTFDISKMADNIETLYKSHGQYLKMSRSAYEFGKKVFSEVEMANSVMKFISEETKR